MELLKYILLGGLLVALINGLHPYQDLDKESVSHLGKVLEAARLLGISRRLLTVGDKTEERDSSEIPKDETISGRQDATAGPKGETISGRQDATAGSKGKASTDESLEPHRKPNTGPARSPRDMQIKEALRSFKSILSPDSYNTQKTELRKALERLGGAPELEQAQREPECFLLSIVDGAFVRRAGEDCESAATNWVASTLKPSPYKTFAAIPDARPEIFKALRDSLKRVSWEDLKKPEVMQSTVDAAFISCIKSDALRRRIMGNILGTDSEVGLAVPNAETLGKFTEQVKQAYDGIKSRFSGITAPVKDILDMNKKTPTGPTEELVRDYQTKRTDATEALRIIIGAGLDEQAGFILEGILAKVALADLQIYLNDPVALTCKLAYSIHPSLTNGYDMPDCKLTVVANLQRRASTEAVRFILDDSVLETSQVFDAFATWLKRNLDKSDLDLALIAESLYAGIKASRDDLERLADSIWKQGITKDMYPKDRTVPSDAPSYENFYAQVKGKLQGIDSFDQSALPRTVHVDLTTLRVGEKKAMFEQLAKEGPVTFALGRMSHPLYPDFGKKSASQRHEMILQHYEPKLPEGSREKRAFTSASDKLDEKFQDWVLHRADQEPSFEHDVISSVLNTRTAAEIHPLLELLSPELRGDADVNLTIRRLSVEQIEQLVASPASRNCLEAVVKHPKIFPSMDSFTHELCVDKFLQMVRNHHMQLESTFERAFEKILQLDALGTQLYKSILQWAFAHPTGSDSINLEDLEFLESEQDQESALRVLEGEFWQGEKKVPSISLTPKSIIKTFKGLFEMAQPYFEPIITVVSKLYPRSGQAPVENTFDELYLLYQQLIKPGGDFLIALTKLKGSDKAQSFIDASPTQQLNTLLQDELTGRPSLRGLYAAQVDKVLAIHKSWVVGDQEDEFATTLYTSLTGETLTNDYSTTFITQVVPSATVAALYNAFNEGRTSMSFSEYVFAQITDHESSARKILSKVKPEFEIDPKSVGLEYTAGHSIASYCQELESKYTEMSTRNLKVEQILSTIKTSDLDNNSETKLRRALKNLTLHRLSSLETTSQATELFALSVTQDSTFNIDLSDPSTYATQIGERLAEFWAKDKLSNHLSRTAGCTEDELLTALIATVRAKHFKLATPFEVISLAYEMVKSDSDRRKQFVRALSDHLVEAEGLYHATLDALEISADDSLLNVVQKIKNESQEIKALVQQHLPENVLGESEFAGKNNQELFRFYLQLLDEEKQRQDELKTARLGVLEKVPNTYPTNAQALVETFINSLDLSRLNQFSTGELGFDCVLLKYAFPDLDSDPHRKCEDSLQNGLVKAFTGTIPELTPFTTKLVAKNIITGSLLYRVLDTSCKTHGYSDPKLLEIFKEAYKSVKTNEETLHALEGVIVEVLSSSNLIVDESRIDNMTSDLQQDVQSLKDKAKDANTLISEVVARMPSCMEKLVRDHIKDLSVDKLASLRRQVSGGEDGIVDLAIEIKLPRLWSNLSTSTESRDTVIRQYFLNLDNSKKGILTKVSTSVDNGTFQTVIKKWLLGCPLEKDTFDFYTYVELRCKDSPEEKSIAHFFKLDYLTSTPTRQQLKKMEVEEFKALGRAPDDVKRCFKIHLDNPRWFGNATYQFKVSNCLDELYQRLEKEMKEMLKHSTNPQDISYHLAGIWAHLNSGEKQQFLPIIVAEVQNAPSLDVFVKIFGKYYVDHPHTLHQAFSKSIAQQELFKETTVEDDLFNATEGGFKEKFESVLKKLNLSTKGRLLGIAPQHLYKQTVSLTGAEAETLQSILDCDDAKYRLVMHLIAKGCRDFKGFLEKTAAEQCTVINVYALQQPDYLCRDEQLQQSVLKSFRQYVESKPISPEKVRLKTLVNMVNNDRTATNKLVRSKINQAITRNHSASLNNGIETLTSDDIRTVLTSNLDLEAFVIAVLNPKLCGKNDCKFNSCFSQYPKTLAKAIGEKFKINKQFGYFGRLIPALYDWMCNNPRQAAQVLKNLRDKKISFKDVNQANVPFSWIKPRANT